MIFLISLVGCVKHASSGTTGTPGLHQFAGANFSSTNSPCLDGVITAIDHSCAVPMDLEEGYPYIMIRCAKVRTGAPPWDKYNIMAITDPSVGDPEEVTIMCMDPYARIYIQSRP
jgi:hypothetical protein